MKKIDNNSLLIDKIALMDMLDIISTNTWNIIENKIVRLSSTDMGKAQSMANRLLFDFLKLSESLYEIEKNLNNIFKHD